MTEDLRKLVETAEKMISFRFGLDQEKTALCEPVTDSFSEAFGIFSFAGSILEMAFREGRITEQEYDENFMRLRRLLPDYND